MTPQEFIPALAAALLESGDGFYVGTIVRSETDFAANVRQKAYDAYKASKSRKKTGKMDDAVRAFKRELRKGMKSAVTQILANVAGLNNIAPPTDKQAEPIIAKVEQLGAFPDGKRHS